MRNTEEIITQCRALPGVTVLEREDGAELQLSTREGTGSMRFFPLFPGLTLAAISVSAPCWPAPVPEDSAPEAKGPLIINDWLSRLQYGCSEKEPERLTYYTRVQVEMAKRIEAILLEDLSRQHTAREFAALFSVSESSVKNYFRSVFGQSIAQCLMSRRMRRAAQQLTDTALPIIDIAGQAGYENQSKFSAAVRRHFGVSPREYRSGKKLTSNGADKSDRAESGA